MSRVAVGDTVTYGLEDDDDLNPYPGEDLARRDIACKVKRDQQGVVEFVSCETQPFEYTGIDGVVRKTTVFTATYKRVL